MKISVNWLQQFSTAPLMPNGVDELVKKIGAQLGAVEEVTRLGLRYQGIVVAKVVSCQPHANADHLSVCRIDDGGVVPNIQRDAQGHVEVVCGAPNVREGILAVWIPPGATVPSTIGKDPLTIEAREIRGVLSNGMLASLHELAIADDHAGILEIDEPAQLGQSFAEVYKLDDYIIDIENKMFTHRPDCFGHLGVARELAGIQGLAFKSPDWYSSPTNLQSVHSNEVPLEVQVQDQKLVPRFMAVAIADIEVKPSPIWLQSYLSRVGMKPINNVVDITNYFMMLTGQPLHAYDADKLRQLTRDQSPIISLEARLSKRGDKLTLLGGKRIEFANEATILITTRGVPVGIGGVMGGADTEVDANTKNIVLECATFDMYTVRKTAMEYGLFTDAATRFTKGQSPLQNDRILAKTVADILQIAGGQVASDIKDVHTTLKPPTTVTLSTAFINERLGENLSADQMATLLRNVEFMVDVNSEDLTVVPPFWRMDIHIPEDVVEEVGRLYGYDHLPLVLPTRDLTPAPHDAMLELKNSLRTKLAAAGANEVLTYSFVHGDLLKKAGQDSQLAYQLTNAISPDLQYYRLSLTPSLLDKVHSNIKAGWGQFALFELGKIHVKGFTDANESRLPGESNRLAFVFAADAKTAQANYSGAPYYEAKKYLTHMLTEAPADITEQPLHAYLEKGSENKEWFKPYEPSRSLVFLYGQKVLGVVGEFKSNVSGALKLPAFAAGFEIALDALGQPLNNYAPLPKFPKVEQDICLKVPAEMPYQHVYNFVHEEVAKQKLPHSLARLKPVDIFQRETDKTHKQITLRLSIASYERTLTDEVVNELLNQVAAAAKEQLGAERI